MHEAHIIFVMKEKRFVFGCSKLCVPSPAEAPWSISVAYHCWLCCRCCACAGCCSIIRAAWGPPCTDYISSSSILPLALGMLWNHRPEWFTNILFFFSGTFFVTSWVTVKERKEVGGGWGSLREQRKGTGTDGNSACSPMIPEHVYEIGTTNAPRRTSYSSACARRS